MIKRFRITKSFLIVSFLVHCLHDEANCQTLRLYFLHRCRLSNLSFYHSHHLMFSTISTWSLAETIFGNYGQPVERPIATIHPPGGSMLNISTVVTPPPV
jgi:hypothetical protein